MSKAKRQSSAEMNMKPSKTPAWFDERLLDDLANLSEQSLGVFKKQWGNQLELGSDRELLVLRDALRRIWSPSEPIEKKEVILGTWLKSHKSGFEAFVHFPLKPNLKMGVLSPASGEIRPALVFLVLRHFRAMRLCANPECTEKYFLAKRKNQVTCQRPACIRYAQAQRSLASYHKRRKEKLEEDGLNEL
jgi:hypothetical protein